MSTQVLVVDDDLAMCEMLQASLAPTFDVSFRLSGSDALDLLEAEPVEVVLTDLRMRGMTGLELCERVSERHPDVPVVVLTAFGSLDSAVQAIKAGAYDYVSKPVDPDALALTLGRAARHHALRDEVARLRRAVAGAPGWGELVGRSPAMQRVFELCARVADSDATVLVTGECGTGKELVARAIHERSQRPGPFVAVNCSALQETLLESELFGHVKGAFTDAHAARKGLFQTAAGGTLLLDEIGDMPPGLQVKLLRVLQQRTLRAVGSDTEVPVDVRVVAATHRDLESAVEEGTFREDLFYRLAVVPIEMPPLRARGGDVLLLAQTFLEAISARTGKPMRGIEAAAADRLLTYPWPGNVRELQNAIERAVALGQGPELGLADLPDRVRNWRRSHVLVASDDPTELVPMEEIEKRYVLRVMEAVQGNKTLAARILGFDRKTLYRKLEKAGYTG